MEKLFDEEEVRDYSEMFDTVLKDFCEGKIFVLQGTIGTWQGQMQGGFIFDSPSGFYRAIEGCDDFTFYDDRGRLLIECSHHDGHNSYEVKELTEMGLKYLEKHGDCKETHTKLMQPPYGANPRLGDFIGY